MKKNLMLACALAGASVMTACKSTTEPNVQQTYVVAVPAPGDKLQGTPSYFDVYQQNRRQQRTNYITADFVYASYQALLRVHFADQASRRKAVFDEQVAQAYKRKEGSAALKLAQEMLYSLTKGMMMPAHSREVGKEFSKIYRATTKEQSPTFNQTIDYSIFSLNSKVCKLSLEEARIARSLLYIEAMPVDLFREFSATATHLAKAAQALLSYRQVNASITNLNMPAKMQTSNLAPITCFDYMLAKKWGQLAYVVKLPPKARANGLAPAEVAKSVEREKVRKALVLLSSKPVVLEENVALYAQLVANLQQLNLADSKGAIAQALPLFIRVAALAKKQAGGSELNIEDREFLNALDRKLSRIVNEQAKPISLIGVTVLGDNQEQLKSISWSNLYKTAELARDNHKFIGIDICEASAEHPLLWTKNSLIEVPICKE